MTDRSIESKVQIFVWVICVTTGRQGVWKPYPFFCFLRLDPFNLLSFFLFFPFSSPPKPLPFLFFLFSKTLFQHHLLFHLTIMKFCCSFIILASTLFLAFSSAGASSHSNHPPSKIRSHSSCDSKKIKNHHQIQVKAKVSKET